MQILFDIFTFITGLFLIFFGIKTFKNSEQTYLERKNKKYKTIYEKWVNEKNTPFFIKSTSIGIIFFGIVLNSIILYNLFFT